MRASRKFTAALAAVVTIFQACSLPSFAAVSPNPVISRNAPAYSGSSTNPSAGNDEHYFSFWQSTSPDYLAYDLSAVPDEQKSKVIAVWYNTSAYDNIGNYVTRNMEPSDYTIEVNKAPGGSYPESGWEVTDTVTGNTLSSRQHIVDMSGYNWIRINVQKADDQEGKNASINFDIHSASEGVSDSWLFLGDSITAGGMNNCYGTGFATYITRLNDQFFPVQENGGIGGITSTDGRNNIDRWLSTCNANFVSIAYGTNDAWGNQTGTEKYYENTKYMIDAVLDAGKIPVLPKIPHAEEPGVLDHLAGYNQVVEKLWEEYGDKLVHGPDLDAYLTEHTEYLSGDGVHPNSEGYEAMRQLWAETMYNNVYLASSDVVTEYRPGDVNHSGDITVSDIVSVLQHVVNKQKYELDEKLADVDGDNDVTSKDAVLIQQYDAGLIASFPVEKK